MQSKCIYYILILFLFFSCKRDYEYINHKKGIVDTVFINLDTIRMLNFDDYFSKIEIIPLSEHYDIILNDSILNKPRSFLIDDKYLLYVYSLERYNDTPIDTIQFASTTDNTVLRSIPVNHINNYFISYYPIYSKYKNRSYYHPGLSNELFWIDTDSLSLVPVLFTDYGNKTITPEIMKNRGKIHEHQMLEGGHYAFTANIFQNNKYYLIETWYLRNTFLSFYDKQSRKTVTGIDYFTNGMIVSAQEEWFFPDIHRMTDEALQFLIRDYRIHSLIDTLYLTEESKIRLKNLKLENNAVIVKYYFK